MHHKMRLGLQRHTEGYNKSQQLNQEFAWYRILANMTKVEDAYYMESLMWKGNRKTSLGMIEIKETA